MLDQITDRSLINEKYGSWETKMNSIRRGKKQRKENVRGGVGWEERECDTILE